jgi:hypothetical protein
MHSSSDTTSHAKKIKSLVNQLFAFYNKQQLNLDTRFFGFLFIFYFLFLMFFTLTNKFTQLFHKLSHCYMFRHYRVILRKLVINILPT